MKLIINWQNATRARPERDRIEAVYKERLLGLCEDDVDQCQKLHDDHYRHHQRPDTQWSKYNAIARQEATDGLLPSERVNACFVVRFER